MKKTIEQKDYLSPAVEIVGVEVENGFAESGVDLGIDSTPYDPVWSN